MTIAELRERVERSASVVGTGSRPALEHAIRDVRRVRGAVTTQLATARGAVRDALTAILDEANRVSALLVENYDATDRHEADAFIKALAVVVRAAVGEEQRRAWWKAADEEKQRAEEARVKRRMEAGNAITVGTFGGTRRGAA